MSAAVAGVRPGFLSRSITMNTSRHQSIHRSLDSQRVFTATSRKPFSSTAKASQSSAIPHISLHIAASSSGKSRKFKPELSTFDFTPSSTNALGLQKGKNIDEKRSSRPDSGQDAYFAASVSSPSSNITAFAIADGVGGWSAHGIDPADFSHGLCSHMASIALSWSASSPKLSPLHLLKLAYKETIHDPDISAGGTTACVAIVDPDGRMRVANLGDSGFLLLRTGSVQHYSDPQTHAFNTPYQMSLTPPEILAQASTFGGMPIDDAPEKADLADHMLRHGDVLVLATDGVWDNLDAQDVLKIVGRIMRESGAWERSNTGYSVSDKIVGLVQKQGVLETASGTSSGTLQAVIAAAVAGEAKSAGLNRKRDGPFAKAVLREYPMEPWRGGKPDDVAVLVVVPVDASKMKGGGREGEVKAKL